MAHEQHYAHGHHESVLASHEWRTLENSAAYLAPHLAPGQRVLDVGSGPGTITLDVARAVAPGEVVGIDSSAAVVERASGLAADEGVENVRFATGDAYALDFEDDSFDVVHAHQLLHHLGDPVAALAEMRRVVAPGGLVAVREVDYSAVAIAPGLPGLGLWRRAFDQVLRAAGGDPEAGRHLKGWALEAGFADVTASASVWCFTQAADRDRWGSAWAVRAVESDFATHAIESGAATTADLQTIAAGWREWVDRPDGWLAMPHGEVLARG